MLPALTLTIFADDQSLLRKADRAIKKIKAGNLLVFASGTEIRFAVFVEERRGDRLALLTNFLFPKGAVNLKMFSKIIIGCAALVLFGCAGGSAYADGLVLTSPQIQQLVPPQASLNLQHQGNSTTYSGGVRWDGTQDVWFGDTSAGPHQNTVSLTDLAIGRAADLRVLININEANGGTMAPITINSLQLNAFDGAGNVVFTADLINGAPVTLDQFRQGQGANSDYYVFGLDDAAIARLQAAMNADPNLRLGLTASVTDANGGPERFSFGAACGPVPKPATMVLLGTGLAGVAGAARRKRRAAAKRAGTVADVS